MEVRVLWVRLGRLLMVPEPIPVLDIGSRRNREHSKSVIDFVFFIEIVSVVGLSRIDSGGTRVGLLGLLGNAGRLWARSYNSSPLKF